MKEIKLAIIVSCAPDGGIGLNGSIPWHLNNDFKWFKETTMGCPIIMGRKTFESIGRALPGRTNIVLSKNTNHTVDGCWVTTQPPLAVQLAMTEASKGGKEAVFLIGGGALYDSMLDQVDVVYKTEVDYDGPTCDTFFHGHELSEGKWTLTPISSHEADDNNTHAHNIVKYERIKE